ncbi:MerR family transcriptional regulator [Streptomyces sp. NPDC002855]|uniref:MerR family transcriptional regulator n=1 Tax=Streptomyces sp. NPDC002855 TaxID=3154437 RepID=UPI0033295A9D
MKISELSQHTGISSRSLRYYEQQGLLDPRRLPNGYRDYSKESVACAERVRDLLRSGLGTEAIKGIGCCFTGSGASLRATVDSELAASLAHELANIQSRIDTLTRNRDAIQTYLSEARLTED